MDDIDGSSNAAQGALENKGSADNSVAAAQSTGFLGRIFGSFAPAETEEGVTAGPDTRLPNQPHGMINLRRLRVEDVAIPAAEIVAIPVSTPKDELVQIFRESGFTRIPVYEGTLDTPIGFVHLKDFALMHGFNGTEADFGLEGMVRPLLFVPPSMTIGVLLTKMQAERRHMALVIDE